MTGELFLVRQRQTTATICRDTPNQIPDPLAARLNDIMHGVASVAGPPQTAQGHTHCYLLRLISFGKGHRGSQAGE